MQHMHGHIPYVFDCWADHVVRLLLRKNEHWLPELNLYDLD